MRYIRTPIIIISGYGVPRQPSLRLRKNFRIGCPRSLTRDRKTPSYGQNKNNTFLVQSYGIVERYNRTLEAIIASWQSLAILGPAE
jgi:hypothetical protein